MIFESVTFMAPAVRIDTLHAAPAIQNNRIRRYNQFHFLQ